MSAFDAIAPFYDLEHDGLTLDTTMYADMSRTFGRDVLVMGAGTGRVVAALAAAGCRVTGVDNSAAMVRRARERLSEGEPGNMVQADMRTVDLGRTFGFVIVPLDTFSLLETQADQVAALRRCAHHLSPTGALVIDLTNPLQLPGPEQNDLRRHRFSAVDGATTVEAWDWVRVDEAAQRMALSIEYRVERGGEESIQVVELPVGWVYRFELEALALLAGLRARNVYGDYDRSAYATESPRLIMVVGFS